MVRPLWIVVVGLAVLVGCSGEAKQVRQLRSPVPQERLQAARWLADHGSESSLAALVDSLEDRDGGVRWAAIEALRERTGQTLGYRAGDSETQRGQAVMRWHQWLQKEGIAPSGRDDGRESSGGPQQS